MRDSFLQRLLQWFTKRPTKRVSLSRAGQQIVTAQDLAKRLQAWENIVMQGNRISRTQQQRFEALPSWQKKEFYKEVMYSDIKKGVMTPSGANPSAVNKLVRRYVYLTMTPMERGLAKHPEMKQWWNSLPADDRQAWANTINSKGISFEKLKFKYRSETMLKSADEYTLNRILNPHASNRYYQQTLINGLANKQGLTIKQFLGGGNTGLAAETSDGRIFKLTNTPSEVDSALRIRGGAPGKTKSLVVSSVRPIRVNGKTTQWYLLQMDKVTTLTNNEQSWWRMNYNVFLEPSISKRSFATQVHQAAGRISDDVEKQEFLKFWNRLIPQRDRILKDFKGKQIWAPEAHPGNVGFDQYGQFKHFDAWAASKGSSGSQAYVDATKMQQRAYGTKPIDIDLNKIGIDLSKIPSNI